MGEPQAVFCSMATLYLVGGLAYLGYLVTERGLLLTLGKGSWIVGFFLHSLFLLFSLFQAGRFPALDPFEASLFFAWVIVLTASLSTLRYHLRILGVFILPIVFLLILLASFRMHQRVFEVGSFSGFYFGLHTVILFFSYAAFSLAFVTGLMYLVLERQIKWKKLGRFYRSLPSLELLEGANRRFVTLGVVGYSFGILFGLFWSRSSLGYWIGPDPKILLSFLTWILYGLLLVGRSFHRIQGRKAILLSVLFFFWVIATFVGVQHPTAKILFRG